MVSYHSKFTPSQSDQKTLEALFVAREKLAQKIMEGICESATSGNKHQRLLVGPRGMGKTHFVALIYHRLQADAELSELLRIAWLKEDPHIAGYPNFLMLVLRKLQQEYPLDHLENQLTAILDMSNTRQQEQALEHLLLECLGDKTLLLIAENLDELLSALKEEGQRKLRAFIQNHSQTTIFATTTSLTDAVTDRNKTFFGFFRTHTLEPFSVQDAAHLLTRLAKRDDNMELANTIWSPLGLARIRAIHYLAGGNPRIYALFYDFLNRQSLDDLVEPFMKLMDELTPYYQALMSKLAPLQQQIIDVLRHQRGAITVKEIAREAMASSQTISSQLGKLQELGYVIQAESLGRSNYYELREPLMRLCLDVKEQHGRTVELFVQFLRVWYGKTELDQLTNDSDCKVLEAKHLNKVSEQDPVYFSLDKEFEKYYSIGEHQQALEIAETTIQRAPNDKKNWQHKAWCLRYLGQPLEEQLTCWKQITKIDSNDAHAWNLQSYILHQLERKEEALEASTMALALKPDNPVFNRNHGINLKETGASAEANEYLEKVLELEGEPKAALDWLQRGNHLWDMDRQHDALNAYCKALELNPYFVRAWETLMAVLQTQGYLKLLLNIAQRATGLIPSEAKFWLSLGISQSNSGDYENALTSYEHALTLDAKLNKATLYRGYALADLGRYNEALKTLEQSQPEAINDIGFQCALVHADTLMWLDRWEEGRDKFNQILERFPLTVWSAKDIFPVITFIARTSNPHVWRRFISVWLELFEHHGCLTQLGSALIHSIWRLSLHWVTEQTAHAWLKVWQDLAGEIEELALPLRLLKAVVEYKANRDQRALLVLPREERGLLEPWLVNLFKEEPDEIDQKIEALFHNIEPKLAEDKKQAQIKEFWDTPAPQPDTLDFSKLLADYSTQSTTTTARYLLPDHWSMLDHAQAEALLRQMATNSENGARALSRPTLKVMGIDKRSVSFSDGDLYQIHIEEDNRYGALDLLATTHRIHLIDGRSEKLHNLFAGDEIYTDTSERQSDYMRFYFSTIRDEESRFHIIDNLTNLHLAKNGKLPDNTEIHSWQLESKDDKERETYSGVMLYSNTLFCAKFVLHSNSNFVEILNAEPIATDLSIETETFDGPIRYVRP